MCRHASDVLIPTTAMFAAGAKALPHECWVLGLSIRLAQYCIGPGVAVSPELAGRFLQLLSWLAELCDAENARNARPEGKPWLGN